MSLQYLQHLTATDGIIATSASALATHWVFNRHEPTALPALFTLLFGVPAAMTPLLTQHYGAVSGSALTFAVFYATLATSIVLYRISPFHPLARYPGPFLARITRWYWTFVALQGKYHIVLQQLHDTYGDIVRVGPNELSLCDMSLAETMLSQRGMPKGAYWHARNMAPPVQSLVALRDKAVHAERRKNWNPAFSVDALKNYEPNIAKRANELVDLLAEKKTADFQRDISLYTYDIMMDALYDAGTDLLVTNDQQGIAEGMLQGFMDSHIYEHMPWLAYLARRLPGIGENTKKFRAELTKKGAERLKKPSAKKDLFYYLAKEDKDEKERPDAATILADAGLAIVAGAGPISGAINNLVFCLLSHPDTYKRLQAEVDQFYPPDSNPADTKHFTEMPYLNAVINEALRMFPAVPDGTQRTPEKGSGGFLLGENFIPEWTNVRVPIYTVHRHPQYWSRPDEWFPDRWLIAKGLQEYDGELKHTPSAFMPFSMGPRNCVGRNLALLEMKMMIVHLMQKLELRFQEGREMTMEQWMESIRDKNALFPQGFPIVARRRV